MRDVLTVADAQASEGKLFLEVCIVDLDLLVRDLDVVIVTVFPKLLLVDLEGVNRTVISLGRVDLDGFFVILAEDQFDVLHLLRLRILLLVDRVDARVILLDGGHNEGVDGFLTLEDPTDIVSLLRVAIV